MLNAIIIYETRKGSTQILADAIKEGLEQSGVKVVTKRIYEADPAELTGYAAIILGSPTYHKNMIENMKTFLFKMEKTDLKGKIGASFGAYGWSGEAVEMIGETMQHIFSMDMVAPKTRLGGKADEFGKGEYREFGRKIAEKIKTPKG
jgi:flavorubredoxin